MCLTLLHIWALFILLWEACRLWNGIVLILNFSSSISSCVMVRKFYKISELLLPRLQNREMIGCTWLFGSGFRGDLCKAPRTRSLSLWTLEPCVCLLLILIVDVSFSTCWNGNSTTTNVPIWVRSSFTPCATPNNPSFLPPLNVQPQRRICSSHIMFHFQPCFGKFIYLPITYMSSLRLRILVVIVISPKIGVFRSEWLLDILNHLGIKNVI